MPHGGPPDDLGPTQGIAGGPGPTPSGFDDGTPQPGEAHVTLSPDQAQEDAERTTERQEGEQRPSSGRPGERQEEKPEHVYNDPAEGKDPPPKRGA